MEQRPQLIYHRRRRILKYSNCPVVSGTKTAKQTQTDRRYRELECLLLITASSEAGWSQEAVDPVGNASVKYKVSLDDPTLAVVDEEFSLVNKTTTS